MLGWGVINAPSPDWGRFGWGVSRKGLIIKTFAYFCLVINRSPPSLPPRVGEGSLCLRGIFGTSPECSSFLRHPELDSGSLARFARASGSVVEVTIKNKSDEVNV